MFNKKLIIAHRGARFYEKENTIPAFKKGIQLKADYIEFDVRKTNKIIVFHDEINGKPKFKILELEKVLKFLKGKIGIDVHLKERGYEIEVIKIILKYFKKKNIIISSEYLDSLRKIKEEFPDIKTGLVMNLNLKNIFIFPKEKIFDYLIPRWQLINPVFITKAKKYNKQVLPWAVNDIRLAKRLLNKNIIAGIITDKPDLMNK